MRARHTKRCSEPSGSARQRAPGFVTAPFLHGAQSTPRFDCTDENKALLVTFGQHVEHPMHAVIEINVSRPGTMARDKFTGRRTREGMTRRITRRRISLALHHDPAARTPDQFTSHQRPRAFDGRLREELPRNHSGTGWSMNFHGTRNFFAKCAASACTPSVSVA